MKGKYIFSIIMCLLATACEETVNRSLSTHNSDVIVVEGTLTNEKVKHLIRLTHSYQTQNEMETPVTGAVVTISNENNSVLLVEYPGGSGEYYTPEVRGVSGKVYTLSIQYKDKQYFAQDSAVPVEPLKQLQYKKVNSDYSLILNSTGQDPYFIEYNINWENTPACTVANNCAGKVVQYDLKTTDVNEIYKPGKEDFTFPMNSVIIRKKYSVSAAYKNFLRSVLSETEWRGGVFDVQRDNVQTNLSQGATGFFAVTTVLTDTTLIK